jgi:hypothetical protein
MKFEKMLGKESEAAGLVAKIVAQGTRRQDLISILEWVTDPKVDRKLRWVSVKAKNLVPSKKLVSGLAARMEHLGRDMQVVFQHLVFAVHPESQRFLKLAKKVKAEALAVRRFPRPNVGKLLSHRSLWKHLPGTLMCIALKVPSTLSYSEAEKLLWYALLARGREGKAVDRGLEREQHRFRQSRAGELFSLLLPGILKDLPRNR